MEIIYHLGHHWRSCAHKYSANTDSYTSRRWTNTNRNYMNFICFVFFLHLRLRKSAANSNTTHVNRPNNEKIKLKKKYFKNEIQPKCTFQLFTREAKIFTFLLCHSFVVLLLLIFVWFCFVFDMCVASCRWYNGLLLKQTTHTKIQLKYNTHA